MCVCLLLCNLLYTSWRESSNLIQSDLQQSKLIKCIDLSLYRSSFQGNPKWSNPIQSSEREIVHRHFLLSLYGDFEHHLQISVGDYIPNCWVMWNIGTFTNPCSLLDLYFCTSPSPGVGWRTATLKLLSIHVHSFHSTREKPPQAPARRMAWWCLIGFFRILLAVLRWDYHTKSVEWNGFRVI